VAANWYTDLSAKSWVGLIYVYLYGMEGTQIGTQLPLDSPFAASSIWRETRENVMAERLSGAPFPILEPAECLRYPYRFYGVKPLIRAIHQACKHEVPNLLFIPNTASQQLLATVTQVLLGSFVFLCMRGRNGVHRMDAIKLIHETLFKLKSSILL